ncbi:(3R)-hydroxymyristoyl-ACP dehydratase [Catenovulum agarivorans DS-2]|uniref:3-hydroxyacyl-[acyl-carrier-protein] dehydratase FabZ n=1 Tax=Catenovulum agarivorans DS-2 TaxID=1328313 RepID=W7QTZ0_9ALTE|nr:3-hydroxyacyl-ACP dehydratase FabZ [Catenovulum agarivorans]EWH11308.1 (3R)-hydroxymyristoyl-ACP dehydratase [Catenovulum agarivorans DS-2]
MTTELNAIDIQEIFTLLPHRYPFLLIDRVIDYKPLDYLHGYKNITVNEPIFTGHFPGKPIFPGVLIVEALAQATGVLGFKSMQAEQDKSPEQDELYLLAGIDNVRFKQPVTPGDQLHLHAQFIKERKGIWKFECKAEVDNKIVCSADIMCARRVM